MKKRIVLWVLPIMLLPTMWVVHRYQSLPQSDAERWLGQQSQGIAQIEVSYGSAWPGSICKYIDVSDKTSIQKIVTSLRCKGSLTNTKMGKPDDALLGYNTSYFLDVIYKDSQRPSEKLVINPSQDRNQNFFLTRRNPKSLSMGTVDIIGWAEMSSMQFANFKSTLNSVPGKRRADRQ